MYYTLNKSHLNSFILLIFPHVANFRYVANFMFLTLNHPECTIFDSSIVFNLWNERKLDLELLW